MRRKAASSCGVSSARPCVTQQMAVVAVRPATRRTRTGRSIREGGGGDGPPAGGREFPFVEVVALGPPDRPVTLERRAFVFETQDRPERAPPVRVTQHS